MHPLLEAIQSASPEARAGVLERFCSSASFAQLVAAAADEIFSVLMGEDVEARRGFIQRNAKDVRFLDI